MESQLKNMRVAELRDIASKAGLNIPVKMTKDKIIAILVTKPEIGSILNNSSDAEPLPAPDAPQQESAAPSSEPAPPVPVVDDLLVPPPDLDWAAQPTDAKTPHLGSVGPAHVAAPIPTEVPESAASNAYGSTVASVTADSGVTEPPVAKEHVTSTESKAEEVVAQPDPHPLGGPSKPIGELEEVKAMTAEERVAARKKRFQLENQALIADKVVQEKQKAAADKKPASVAAIDVGVSKKASEQSLRSTGSKANGNGTTRSAQADAGKANGTYNIQVDPEVLAHRAKKFAAVAAPTTGSETAVADSPITAGDGVVYPPMPASINASRPAQPQSVVVDEEAGRRLKRQQAFSQLLPGQPGYDDAESISKPPSKRHADDDLETQPETKRAKSDPAT